MGAMPALAAVLLLFGVSVAAPQVNGLSTVKAPPPAVGNFSTVVDAKLFQMYYGQSFKVIKNGVDGTSYLLMQNASKMASRTKYCTGRIKSFVVPPSNFSIDTTNSPVSFFELLGVMDSLKGISSEQITSPCLLQSHSNGNIRLVNTMDAQQLSQFIAYFGNSVDGKGCNFVTYAPAQEVQPLQRAEWIKYLGAFTNTEFRANAIYDSIKSNYLCLSKTGANRDGKSKPVVAWMEYKQGKWTFAKEGYKLQYVADAGGENIDATVINNGYNVSDSEDLDNLHAILCTIDVILDQTYTAEPANYTLPTFLENLGVEDTSCFSFLANKNIWRYDKRAFQSSLDWFDGAVSQPQLVLADMIEIFFPTGNYTTNYFRNLAKGEGVTEVGPEACSRSISAPMEPTLAPCQ